MQGWRRPGSGRGSENPITVRPRVIVADDHVLLREGIASLLTRCGFEVVGLAGDGSQLLELVRERVPDLVIVDIRMPPTFTTEGLRVARRIREEFPQIALVVLSAYVEVEHALELVSSGDGIGYLLKSRVTDVTDLIDSLKRILRGGSVIDSSLVRELFGAYHREDPLAGLSAREREVLALMAEGRSNAGIAQKLWITEGTVEKHVHGILTKLRLPDTETHHRRVLAVLAFLNAGSPGTDSQSPRRPGGSPPPAAGAPQAGPPEERGGSPG
jgi:DNA-binding NarL/FixJ family response regulator